MISCLLYLVKYVFYSNQYHLASGSINCVKMNKIKEIYNKIVHPKDYHGMLVFITLMMKISGLYPIKIVTKKGNFRVRICKWGVCCTITHFILYVSCVTHGTMNNIRHNFRPAGGSTVGNIADFLLIGLEELAAFVIFVSVFYSLSYQKIWLKKYIRIKNIYEELKIDNTDLLKKNQYLIYLFISLLCIHMCFVIFLVIYSFYAVFKKLPPIMLFFLTILPHFYIFMKVSHFIVAAILLNSSFKELIKLLAVIEK